MSGIDSRSGDSVLSQRSDYHLSMFVAGKICCWADHSPINVSLIMEHCATSTATTHEVDGAETGGLSVSFRLCMAWIEKCQVDLQPWILVSSDDDARPVDV